MKRLLPLLFTLCAGTCPAAPVGAQPAAGRCSAAGGRYRADLVGMGTEGR